MFTPFEELEYLSEYLPEEGECVLVTRQDGELHCTEWHGDRLRDGIDDASLYGLLVQCNEALNARATLPLWATGVGVFWLLTVAFVVGGLGWDRWFLVPGAGLTGLWMCFLWIRLRQRWTFQSQLLPRIQAAVRARQIDVSSLLAGMRQHAELRTLLDQFAQSQGACRGEFDQPA